MASDVHYSEPRFSDGAFQFEIGQKITIQYDSLSPEWHQWLHFYYSYLLCEQLDFQAIVRKNQSFQIDLWPPTEPLTSTTTFTTIIEEPEPEQTISPTITKRVKIGKRGGILEIDPNRPFQRYISRKEIHHCFTDDPSPWYCDELDIENYNLKFPHKRIQ